MSQNIITQIALDIFKMVHYIMKMSGAYFNVQKLYQNMRVYFVTAAKGEQQ